MTWANPRVRLGGAAGRAAGLVNMNGQNWGFAPFSPGGLHERRTSSARRAPQHAPRRRGAHRPRDGVEAPVLDPRWPPRPRRLRRYPFEDLVRIIALRVAAPSLHGDRRGSRDRAAGFRPAMQRAGEPSYRVLYFERGRDGGFRRPRGYPEEAMVTISTHDLPTLKGYWTASRRPLARGPRRLPDDASIAAAPRDRGPDRAPAAARAEARGPPATGSTPEDRALTFRGADRGRPPLSWPSTPATW